MENQFKLRVFRMFRSSFGSCKSKNINDVIERPALLSENHNQNLQSNHPHHHQQLIELFSPRLRPLPSICRPRWPESFQTEQGCIVSKNHFPRSKVTERRSLLLAADVLEGQKCPPASPASPLRIYCKFQDGHKSQFKNNLKRSRKTINKRVRARPAGTKSCGTHDFPAPYSYNGLFSSDDESEDEDDKTTLFSSRSLSSDSSESFRRGKAACRSNKAAKNPRRRAVRNEFETDVMPLDAKVKDSFAVVKRSSDPYNDFRTSMVEMIIEKQIFSGNDLENLLQCFLSLNSSHHHKVIIQVFTEIWEALFSNWS